MKYGSNTKWCTTAKNNESIFKNYTRDGFLGYLIDKTETKTGDYKKIALYLEYNSGGINESVKIYDVKDKYAHETFLIESGWDVERLFEIFTMFRYHFIKAKENKKRKYDRVDAWGLTLINLRTVAKSRLLRKETSNDLFKGFDYVFSKEGKLQRK